MTTRWENWVTSIMLCLIVSSLIFLGVMLYREEGRDAAIQLDCDTVGVKNPRMLLCIGKGQWAEKEYMILRDAHTGVDYLVIQGAGIIKLESIPTVKPEH